MRSPQKTPQLRVIDGGASSLEARLDKALETELKGALEHLVQTDRSDLAERINRLLSALDRPRKARRLPEVDPYGCDASLAKRVRGFLQKVIRVEGKVPETEAAVVVGARAWLIAQLLHPRDARALVSRMDVPVLNVLLNRLGCVHACPENALRMLGEGRVVVMERDFAKVAVSAQAPVLKATWDGLRLLLSEPLAPGHNAQLLADRVN